MKDKLLPLKFAVYAMGIMLLGGFLWLGGKLAMKASELNSEVCREITLPAPAGITALPLHSLRFQSDQWVLTYQDNYNTVAFRYDKCGKLLQSFRIEGGIPPLPTLPELPELPPQPPADPNAAPGSSSLKDKTPCGLAAMAAEAAKRAEQP